MNATEGGSVGPVIPSGQPEVKIRTLASDVLSIKESGGGLPQFQTIHAPQLSMGGAQKVQLPASVVARRRALVIVILIAVAAVCLFGYFLYQFLATGTQRGGSSTGTQGGGGTESTSNQPFIHTSAFRRLTDQKLQLVIPKIITEGAELQTYNQRFQKAVELADLTAKFMEVEAKNENGTSLGVADVFTAANTFVIDKAFLAGHFNPDVTVFAYREEEDVWPGYVFLLKAGENTLSVKSEVAKLEASTYIPNFFLDIPSEGRGEFYDGRVGNQPVRVSDFPSGARFVYGWVGERLILSTSYSGFVEAASRL